LHLDRTAAYVASPLWRIDVEMLGRKDFSRAEQASAFPLVKTGFAPTIWFAGVKVACGDDLWCLSVQRRKPPGLYTDLAHWCFDKKAAPPRGRQPGAGPF
jgi:hypothetical protein